MVGPAATFQTCVPHFWPEAGERLVVPPACATRSRTQARGIAHLVVEAEPALELRESIEDGVRLGRAGMLTANGNPRGQRGLIEAAALAHRYRETVVLSSRDPARPRAARER
jgi:hypothetical protein